MRVVYLHQYFVTPEMAGGTRSYEMARRLVKAGMEVHMVTSDRENHSGYKAWRQSDEAGITVHWTPVKYDNTMGYAQRLWAFIAFAFRAARKAAQLEGDVIFATSTPLTIAIPGVWASRKSKTPMVFEVRDLWPAVPIAIGALRNPVAKWAANRLEKFAYNNAKRIVALAPGMRDEIVATGYPAEHVTVITNGCELESFSKKESGEALRAEHEWLRDRPLLVYAGTFGWASGIDYIVRLASAIDSIDPEVRIAAIGSGRAFENTQQLAKDAGVLDKNLFLPGRLPKRETKRWTIAADINLALLTGPEILYRDAVQNKFFDSLAAGRPVASNFTGFQSKLAVETGAGLIISATDVDAAARQLVNCLRDGHWLDEAGRTARRLAEERFDLDKLAEKLASVLTDAREQGT